MWERHFRLDRSPAREGGAGQRLRFGTGRLILGQLLSGSLQPAWQPFHLFSHKFPLINRKEKGLADQRHLHLTPRSGPQGSLCRGRVGNTLALNLTWHRATSQGLQWTFHTSCCAQL